jgi:hypothetical protein
MATVVIGPAEPRLPRFMHATERRLFGAFALAIMHFGQKGVAPLLWGTGARLGQPLALRSRVKRFAAMVLAVGHN